MTYKVVIIDDEPLARRGVSARLKDTSDFVVVDDCADGISGIKAIRRHRPDLVFLDIEMPGLSGFDMLTRLPKKSPPLIIFLTAYGQYALSAFDVNALDYLLKPIDNERFGEAIDRARLQLKHRIADTIEERLRRLIDDKADSKHRYVERFMVRTGGRITFVLAEEIDWIEAVGDYASLHVGTKSSLIRESLNTLEINLNPEIFIRIHRSTIIQLSKVAELRTLPNRELRVKLTDGTDLKVSRTYRDRFDEWLSGK